MLGYRYHVASQEVSVQNNFKTGVLMAALGGLFIAIGSYLGGQSGAIMALVLAGVMNLGMYFFSDKIALRSAGAQAVEEHQLPNVYSIVRSLAQRENMPMPRIYLINSQQPNAFATGRNPKHAAVAVTAGIMDIMSYGELEGVLAHELAHVKNRDILIASIAATVAAALSLLARMSLWGGIGGDRRNNNPLGPVLGLVALIVAPLAAAVIQMAISRSREYQADKAGALTTGAPMQLASALEKIGQASGKIPMNVNPAVSQLFIGDPLKALGGQRGRGIGGLSKMFSTHPPMEERIQRLSDMAMGVR